MSDLSDVVEELWSNPTSLYAWKQARKIVKAMNKSSSYAFILLQQAADNNQTELMKKLFSKLEKIHQLKNKKISDNKILAVLARIADAGNTDNFIFVREKLKNKKCSTIVNFIQQLPTNRNKDEMINFTKNIYVKEEKQIIDQILLHKNLLIEKQPFLL